MGDHMCPMCGKFLSGKSALTRHLKDTHSVIKDLEKAYRCHVCDKAFAHNKSLGRHIRDLHPTEAKQFICSECNASFEKTKELYRHQKEVHNLRPESEVSCHVCGKNFSCTSTRNRHLKDVHGVAGDLDHTTLICPLCDNARFPTTREVNNHITNSHNISLEIASMHFPSFEEYESWRQKMEETEMSHYVKSSGKKKVAEGLRCYYRCHRSGLGRYKEDVEGVSWKPTMKIGAYCPSTITLTELTTGGIDISFVKTHLGHSIDMQFLTKAQRALLAEKDPSQNVSEGQQYSEKCGPSLKLPLADTISKLHQIQSLLQTAHNLSQKLTPDNVHRAVEHAERFVRMMEDMVKAQAWSLQDQATQTGSKRQRPNRTPKRPVKKTDVSPASVPEVDFSGMLHSQPSVQYQVFSAQAPGNPHYVYYAQ